jgi:diguanylate cyclase (GGDEF)-like protein
MAVFWMDLDRFKEINDSLGHIIGDQLLCTVAARLSHALDGRGHVARFGGDEFILICPGADRTIAEQIAGDVMAEFSHDFDVSGYHLTVTASMTTGVTPKNCCSMPIWHFTTQSMPGGTAMPSSTGR